MTDTVKIFPCGCVNSWSAQWEMWKNDRKCPTHTRAAAGDVGLDYYRKMGVFGPDGKINACYAVEMDEALSQMGNPSLPQRGLVASYLPTAIEVGGGPGVHTPWLCSKGFDTVLVEPDFEACRSYSGMRYECTWGDYFQLLEGANLLTVRDPSLIMAAHVCEHMKAGPAVFPEFFQVLRPGGALLVIVPDDQDPLNPGHVWFYNEPALRKAISNAGFEDVRTWATRRIPREQFIYAYARKPLE